MKSLILSIFFLLLGVNFSFAQESAVPTDKVLKKAYQSAKKQKKNVLVMFHASWCGWCKRMDQAINDPACKKYFDKNYVIVHLDVLERGDKEKLENPGGEEFMNQHGGENQGLPYWIVLDPKGTLLADSKMPANKANTGCPASPEEVAHLLSVLQKTGTFDAEALKAIETRFRKNAE